MTLEIATLYASFYYRALRTAASLFPLKKDLLVLAKFSTCVRGLWPFSSRAHEICWYRQNWLDLACWLTENGGPDSI
jgi:hypothetical protein